MINIRPLLEHGKVKFHFDGFLRYAQFRLLNKSEYRKVKPAYRFEKKFYRELLINKNFARSIILADKELLVSFVDSEFYKKHRLYFLLCLSEKVREEEPFKKHFDKECKNLPREVKHKNLDTLSNEVRARCFKVFNYKKFSRVNRKKKANRTLWNAYNLLSGFIPKSCPYCNLESLTLLEKEHGDNEVYYILRPALDHFLAKDLYPFFSVSLYNLVPSCSVCNSDLKGELDFRNPKHISPMGEAFDKSVNFALKFSSNVDTLDAIDNIYNLGTIDVNHCEIIIDGNEPASMNNAEVFQLEKRYNYHKDQLSRFIGKLPKVTTTNIESFMDIVGTESYEDALSDFVDFDVSNENHANIPLSIVKLDLLKKYTDQLK